MRIWGDGRGKGKNDKTRMLIISESRWKVFNALFLQLPAGFKIRKKEGEERWERKKEKKGGKTEPNG